MFGGLVTDDARNDRIRANVHNALIRGRNCRCSPRRTAHVEDLAAMWRRRSRSYTQLGFTIVPAAPSTAQQQLV